MKIPLDMPIILEPRFPQPNFSTNIFLQARKYYNLQLRSSNNMPCYTSDIREGSKVKMGGGGGGGGVRVRLEAVRARRLHIEHVFSGISSHGRVE